MNETESNPFTETRDMNGLFSHNTCYYCKLTHRSVEAGGVYYCPNPLCSGCGAASWRAKRKTFKENDDGKHTVDPEEMLRVADEALLDRETRAAAENMRSFLGGSNQ